MSRALEAGWEPTGKRRLIGGRWRAEMALRNRDGELVKTLMFCRANSDCPACVEGRDHGSCPEGEL